MHLLKRIAPAPAGCGALPAAPFHSRELPLPHHDAHVDHRVWETGYGHDRWNADMMLDQCGKAWLGDFVGATEDIGHAIAQTWRERPRTSR